MTVFTSLYFLS